MIYALLTKLSGQPVVIDSRIGAWGIIAAAAVAKSPPDGHTLLLMQSSVLRRPVESAVERDILESCRAPRDSDVAHTGSLLFNKTFKGAANMRRIHLLALALVASPFFCQAQAPAVLGKCIIENITEKDRNDLARWVFFSMAAHPEMRQFSSISARSREDTSRAVGVLFTRLMTDACAKELQKAAQAGGPPVVPSAIQFLTQIGVQELMTSRDVLGTLSTFSQFADKERIDRASRQR